MKVATLSPQDMVSSMAVMDEDSFALLLLLLYGNTTPLLAADT
jgi:hypothetical protein